MHNGITLEICIENGSRINELIAKGADRVELNDNMASSGTTVSYGVAENVIRRCHAAGITVASMVRPRGGDFVYDDEEFSIMLRDLEVLQKLNTDAVVFGCLTHNGLLDKEKILRFVKAVSLETAGSKKTGIVFHMAFDYIQSGAQLESLLWLADAGITRILTRGSADPSSSAADNRE